MPTGFPAILSTFLPAILVTILLFQAGCGGSQEKKKQTYNLDRNPPLPAADQAYFYNHKGPRPWSDGRQDATGGRLIVIPNQDSQNPSLWNAEEHFERADGAQVLQIDKKYQMHYVAIKSGESEIALQYSPPIPLRFLDVKKDKKETFKSRFSFLNPQTKLPLEGRGTYSAEVERRYDVRIVSPAGAYLCRQLILRITIETAVQDIQTSFKATVHSYWCDDIGWFVKEEYAFEPMFMNGQEIQPAYTAESVLTQYKPMDLNSLHLPDENRGEEPEK